MKAREEQEQQRVVALFQAARDELVTAPPYLEARVLARLQSQKKLAQKLLWWRSLTVALLLMLSFGFGLLWTRSDSPEAFLAAVGRPMAVKVELASVQDLKASGLEIELPEGVSFYSETITSLAEEKVLRLHISPGLATGDLPIVIRSQQKGLKEIKLRFLNADHEIISEKSLKIQFKQGDLS